MNIVGAVGLALCGLLLLGGGVLAFTKYDQLLRKREKKHEEIKKGQKWSRDFAKKFEEHREKQKEGSVLVGYERAKLENQKEPEAKKEVKSSSKVETNDKQEEKTLEM